jgi:hypothetical protein
MIGFGANQFVSRVAVRAIEYLCMRLMPHRNWQSDDIANLEKEKPTKVVMSHRHSPPTLQIYLIPGWLHGLVGEGPSAVVPSHPAGGLTLPTRQCVIEGCRRGVASVSGPDPRLAALGRDTGPRSS